MKPLLQRVALGEIIVADGAWGTVLMEHGLHPGLCPEALNLERPELLTEIGSLYVEAGAEILTTNTFGGSPLKLSAYALEDRVDEINRNGVRALRQAAGERAYVSASVGPSGKLLEPYGDTPERDVYESFERQIRALAAAGADLVCIETMSDLREACLAIEAARTVAPGLPVVATMTFDPTPRGFFTVMGVDVFQAADGLSRAGADVVGSNCGSGIETLIDIAREFKIRSALPIAIQANAGLPENRNGTVVYPETPAFLQDRAALLVELGVSIIGGCCGTTPDHVRAIRHCVDQEKKPMEWKEGQR